MALRLSGSNQQHQLLSAVSLDGQLHIEDRSIACVVHRVFKRKTAATGVCCPIAAVRQAAVFAAHVDITHYLQTWSIRISNFLPSNINTSKAKA